MLSKEQKKDLLKRIFNGKKCFGKYWDIPLNMRSTVCNYLIYSSKYSRCIACMGVSEKGANFEEIEH